jgi:hypothetical protein
MDVPNVSEFAYTYRDHSNLIILVILCALVMLMISTKRGRRLVNSTFRFFRPRLRFETYERHTVWFATMADGRYIVSLKSTWRTTNRSRQGVMLKDFYVKGLATEHHMISSSDSPGAGALIPPKASVDVEIFCLVRKTLTWRSGPFVADVCLVDDAGHLHTVKKVRFNYFKQAGVVSPKSGATTPRPLSDRGAGLEVPTR